MAPILLYRSKNSINNNNKNNIESKHDHHNTMVSPVARGSSLSSSHCQIFIIVGIALIVLFIIFRSNFGGVISMFCSGTNPTSNSNHLFYDRSNISTQDALTVRNINNSNGTNIDLIDLMKATSSDSNTIQKEQKELCTNKESNTKSMVWIDDWIGKDVSTNRIPKIIHQTSKSRCVTKRIGKATSKWKFGQHHQQQTLSHQSTIASEWSYYFHDDATIDYLFQYGLSQFEMEQLFPNLQSIVSNCILYGTMKADLWRYVVLWIYGGIYVDIDAIPNKVRLAWNDTTTMSSERSLLDTMIDFTTDDAVFVVEQYHLLSQWFMAVSPRHPLMYYAIQYSLLNLIQSSDITRINAAYITGPHALHKAYQRFRMDYDPTIRIEDAIPGSKPVSAGYYIGTNNRTIKVIGTAADQNEYIIRDILGRTKTKDYAAMNMTHFLSDKQNLPSNISCMKAIFESYSRKNFNST